MIPLSSHCAILLYLPEMPYPCDGGPDVFQSTGQAKDVSHSSWCSYPPGVPSGLRETHFRRHLMWLLRLAFEHSKEQVPFNFGYTYLIY